MRQRRRSVIALGTVAALTLAIAPTAALADTDTDSDFVTVQGTDFMLGGEEFYALGSNNYYPMYSGQAMTDAVFAKAQDAGFNTMRVWGFFAIGSPGDSTEVPSVADKDKNVYFQYWDDTADEPAFNDGATGLEHLDMVVARAEAHGLKLILPLTNNWGAFGGMDQYLHWAQAAGEAVDTHDDFYTNATVKGWYKEWISHLLNRTNTVTGKVYKDDPTIMTWELANEPRCIGDGGDGTWGNGFFPRDPGCDATTITPWVEEMSAYIKSIDANHLVSTGDEGFFSYPDGKDKLYDGTDGVDTVAWANVDTIDYMSYHLYPDHWGTDAAWGTQWIKDHNEAAANLSGGAKPALMGEFGWLDKSTRNSVYQEWLDAQVETDGAGSLYWILSDVRDDGTLYPDYDGFTVYCPGSVCTTIQNHGALKSGSAEPIAPVADHDTAHVAFGSTADVPVTANDIAYGANIDVASVDLDPAAAGRQDTLTLADASVSVDASGAVSVVPAAGFAGEITFTYVVSDTAARVSNEATVTVVVAPSEDAWVTLEDFSGDASAWSCAGGSTVTVEDGVGVFTNTTGAWDWCMYNAPAPLDLANAGLFRFDFLDTTLGVNPEVAFTVGDDNTWAQRALDTGTWNEPRVGDEGPTVTLSRFPEDFRAQMNDVRQVGIGIQVGEHRFDNFRYDLTATGGGNEEVVVDHEGGAAGWTCSDGASVSVEGGVGVFTNPSGWAWCEYVLASPLDVSAATEFKVDFIDTDSGVNPEVAFKTGDAWTWGGQTALESGSWFGVDAPAQALAYDLAGIDSDFRDSMADLRAIEFGIQGGTHRFDNFRFGLAGESEEPEVVETELPAFESAGLDGWTCSDGASISVVDGEAVIANTEADWAWCGYQLPEAGDFSGAYAIAIDFLGTDSGVNPSFAFQTGDGWAWGELTLDEEIWDTPLVGADAPRASFSRLDEGYQATLGDVRQVSIGVHRGIHTFDNLRLLVDGAEDVTLQDFADAPASAWECDRDGAVVVPLGSSAQFRNDSGDWSWCGWTLPESLDLSEAQDLLLDFVSTDSGVGPEVAFKTGDGWAWGGQVKPADVTWFNPEDEGSTMAFDLTAIASEFRDSMADVRQIVVGVHGGTHVFANPRFTATSGDEPEEPAVPEEWVTVEDFTGSTDGWSCDQTGATVSASGGVGTIANNSGTWAWCLLTLDEPLDASKALELQVEFLATDSGVGPEVAFKAGADWTWGGQLKPTGTAWFDSSAGPATMEFDLTSIDSGYRDLMTQVHQIGIGVHPGTHEFGEFRLGYASGDAPEVEEPGTEEPGTEEPGTEEPGGETPGGETPGTEEPGGETPGSEEPGAEEPGTEIPEPSAPSLHLEVSTLVAGQPFSFTGSGFEPGAAISIGLDQSLAGTSGTATTRGGAITLGTVVADSDGSLAGTLTVPADLASGQYALLAWDTEGNALSFLTVTVEAAEGGATDAVDSTGDALPSTGADVQPLVWIALVSLLMGGVLLLLHSRRGGSQGE